MQRQYLLRNPQDTYREQGVLTAGPMELIIMLYNGLRKNMVMAQRDIKREDPAADHNHLIKAQSIVNELLNSLDMSFDISQELLNIYEFILHKLIMINTTKNADDIEPLLGIVDTLREAWQEVGKSQKGGLYAKEE
jgi:flagellar protein FliS